MATPINDTTAVTSSGSSIAELLALMGPIRVEGDQGAWTGHSLPNVIAAADWERKNKAMKTKGGVAAVLRTIGGHRLVAHDGRASGW